MEERKSSFKSVQLFKDQTLGIGSYGAVCKAKCDDLLCAAKIIHPTLFYPTTQLQVVPTKEHRLPIKRFEQECEFLSTIRHPNVVQYLCMHQDPDTGLPVLLMELMDENLTLFLDNYPQPIAYHTQANLCHDIALALSFLHSNGIVHRDLSSNNVLLFSNIRAKVTDFGMAKLSDLNSRSAFTMCPGTDVYMPPEAVCEEPLYTEKIDCFSFGVIIIQMLTQQFPEPGNRRAPANQPGLPNTAEVPVAEVVRRRNHISQVEPNHPLLPIALDCLKDKDTERPSAPQLCERMARLKERPEYSESVTSAQQEKQILRQQLQHLQQSLSKEREDKDRELGQMAQQLQQLQLTLMKEREENKKLQQSVALQGEEIKCITRMRDEKEKQLNQELESSLQERSELDKQFHYLEERLLMCGELPLKQQDEEIADRLVWRQAGRAPFSDRRWCDASLDGNRLYFLDGDRHLWMYDIREQGWTQLPDCLYGCSSLTVLHKLPTTVGGDLTNKLMSLSTEGKWIEKFHAMPTKRCFVTAVCTGTALIVAGGSGQNSRDLTTVEVLNIENDVWSTALDLPEPLQYHSATISGDDLYMLGGEVDITPTNSVYTCSVSALLQTCTQRSLVGSLRRALSLSSDSGVWNKLADLPVTGSTCVSLCGQLLAIGGMDFDLEPSTAVYAYDTSTDSWDIKSHMTTTRRYCFAAVLPDNQLMVVGGWIDKNQTRSDSIEFGDLV